MSSRVPEVDWARVTASARYSQAVGEERVGADALFFELRRD